MSRLGDYHSLITVQTTVQSNSLRSELRERSSAALSETRNYDGCIFDKVKIYDYYPLQLLILGRSNIRQHSSRQSCWLIISGIVYDVTNFVDSHPGGASLILKYAGKDATQAYEPLHASDTLEKHLSDDQRLGSLVEDDFGLPSHGAAQTTFSKSVTTDNGVGEISTAVARQRCPRLSSMISLADFAQAAKAKLSATSYAFLSSGAEDNVSLDRNLTSWRVVRLRPRILRPMPKPPNIQRRILGNDFSVPFVICPAGGAKLCHPEGDTLLTKAAFQQGALQWVCNNAGRTQKAVAAARGPGQILYWQIYAMKDLKVTEDEIRSAIALGFKGFALTVDAIWAGKRELDLRARLAEDDDDHEDTHGDVQDQSFMMAPKVNRPPVYTEFTFDTAITWLKSLTDLPIVIKGVQTWEDALLCHQYGVHPWLSNHGGRQLDSTPSGLETLLDIHEHCPVVLRECQVLVDGGVTRGADVVKALALGCRAVGIGRGFLYSMVFGLRGIEKAMEILKHEIETTLALLGVMSLDELGPQHVSDPQLCKTFGPSEL
ncbi:hypothetical protein PV08_02285 [Exophiala spinifera]|uniref:Cytochrome b2, mitochondrial n=1 Tax=Exophiala spinifera TaxID=91928 RepID=A0A0D2BGC4_9EURO|nr:uncharacterized protein PV08_02285 [Exophiala spinifera]KIW17998.1 hypothetical protein PV08_02285 [Exophiala spinifera]